MYSIHSVDLPLCMATLQGSAELQHRLDREATDNTGPLTHQRSDLPYFTQTSALFKISSRRCGCRKHGEKENIKHCPCTTHIEIKQSRLTRRSETKHHPRQMRTKNNEGRAGRWTNENQPTISQSTSPLKNHVCCFSTIYLHYGYCVMLSASQMQNLTSTRSFEVGVRFESSDGQK